MSDDFIILAAGDQEIYNSNHITWMNVWMAQVPKSVKEILECVTSLSEDDGYYIERCIALAIILVKKHSFEKSVESRQDMASDMLPFLVYVKQFVSGSLYTFINHIQFKHDTVVPQQAPKGWKCSLCLSSGDSHLTLRTECGHIFHYRCCIHLTNPACPLCRQIMNI
jgi:hypothetical protein